MQKLKSAIASYEKEIAAALYSDLKKNEEESYATETGLVLAEITGALKNLRTFVFVPKKNHLRKTSTLPFN